MPTVFRSGSRGDDEDQVVSDRILTIPNLLSLLRMAALPFVYLDIVNGRELRAVIVLLIVTWSDYFDGYIARRFDQVSRVGKLFDPISDRILVVVVGIAMIVADIVPWWAIAVVLARDVLVLLGGLVLVVRRIPPPDVSDLGKAATFGLMGALPIFIVARGLESLQLRGSAWALLVSFGALYYVAAGQYVLYAREQMRDRTVIP